MNSYWRETYFCHIVLMEEYFLIRFSCAFRSFVSNCTCTRHYWYMKPASSSRSFIYRAHISFIMFYISNLKSFHINDNVYHQSVIAKCALLFLTFMRVIHYLSFCRRFMSTIFFLFETRYIYAIYMQIFLWIFYEKLL